MIYTQAQIEILEQRLGARIDAIDVTTYGNAERMFLIITPVCGYCGSYRPHKPMCPF